MLFYFYDQTVHFPLRGQEQAEFIAMHAPEIKCIYTMAKNK